MSQRKSGFGAGFSRDVEAVLGAASLGHLYGDEVRENLRIAGMVLREQHDMPILEPVVPEFTDGAFEDFEYGEGDLHVQTDDDGEEPA